MARALVTQAAVNDVAEALLAEGTEPSILNVQARIGGGSYSTVKRYLDVWKQRRAEDAAIKAPAEVEARGLELARAVWAVAAAAANREAQAAREDAAAAVAAMREELAEARNEIARLERLESEQAGVLEQLQGRLREAELQLAETKLQAGRVAELEPALAAARAERDAAREEAKDKAVEMGKRSGEAEALRAQVRELLAALKPKAPPATRKGKKPTRSS
jgi:septal ring factor EnvC (AmiA/AmiB activator)